jgi:hypothetical protein
MVTVTLEHHGMRFDLVTMDERPDDIDQDVVRRAGVDDSETRVQCQGNDCVCFNPQFDDAQDLDSSF